MSAAPQLALWCSRACDGINREWVGGARGRHPVHGDVSHFLRLSAWRVALEMRDRPVALVLTRQDVPTLDRGQYVRVVSMPSWELFDAQPRSYRDSVLPPLVRSRLAVEAGASQGWCKYAGDESDVIGVDRFGAR